MPQARIAHPQAQLVAGCTDVGLWVTKQHRQFTQVLDVTRMLAVTTDLDTLLMRMSEDDFTSVIDTNLTGAFRVIKRASKGMIRARKGRVVLISSVSGLYGAPGQINYSASKAGLVGIARSLTRELGSRGITANVVAPGFINTDMTAELPEATQKDYLSKVPAARFAEASEVANVVRWIASDEAAYISGAVIPVDGGLGMGH